MIYTGLNGADNVGGLLKIEICRTADCANDDLSDAAWQEVYFTQGSAGEKKTGKRDQFGRTRVFELTFRAPKKRTDVEQFISDYAGPELGVRITNANKSVEIVGSKSLPLELSDSYESGENYTDKNEYSFQITGLWR